MPYAAYFHYPPEDHPEFHDHDKYFTMSGTSQAAAVVSGVAALMLDAKPWLSPDDVKCQLITSARPALDANGALAYSPLQQKVLDAVASAPNVTQFLDRDTSPEFASNVAGPRFADFLNDPSNIDSILTDMQEQAIVLQLHLLQN